MTTPNQNAAHIAGKEILDRIEASREANRRSLASRLVDISTLEGKALDVAVAICEDVDPQAAYLFHDEGHYQYSTSWELGGEILERERITLDCWDDPRGEPWVAQAWAHGNAEAEESGATPLVAAMRCYVARKHGTQIELPAGAFED